MRYIKNGEENNIRFNFGRNWRSFLAVLNEGHISEAQKSLKEMLECENMAGKKFLDIGCGSGLFSLAARRLGASVLSFDYDQECVACARELKYRYCKNDTEWNIIQGSVLNESFVGSVGRFDIVYCWGVMSHTGNMWKAMENVLLPLDKGQLFISVYRNKGLESKLWWHVKRFAASGFLGRTFVHSLFIPCFWLWTTAASLISGQNLRGEYKRRRGMSMFHDWIDWLGGFPFEYARADEVFCYYKRRGLKLDNFKCLGSTDEFVFSNAKLSA